MFLNAEDFDTTLYDELVDAISREDETILPAAIDAAISEAKGYLQDFDTATIFSQVKKNRHPLLLLFVKDIAIWHFIAVSNPATDMQMRETRYKSAISWLKGVQKGEVTPDLPRVVTTGEQTGSIRFGSNSPRGNHF